VALSQSTKEKDFAMNTYSSIDGSVIDLSFQPQSYWGPQDLETHFGARSKGELRRNAALSLLADGVIDANILSPETDDTARRAAGATHPWMIGGAYLPDFLPDEVEIARVVMRSVTMDVISVRARLVDQAIQYRIVDEYMDEGSDPYKMRPETSETPLTMQQLIDAIEEANLVNGPRELNYMESPEDVYDFCSVISSFYPELGHWFEESNEQWLRDELEKIAEETDDE